MADDEHALQQHAPTGHYSEHNKIPNIKQFVEGLDRDKRRRDKEIEEHQQARAAAQARGEALPHRDEKTTKKGTAKTVTDPTTGHQVIIEDVDKNMMKHAENPTVRGHHSNPPLLLLSDSQLTVPNHALGKDAVGHV